jgi:hypothetical protein
MTFLRYAASTAAITLACALTACASRQVTSIAMAQPGDEQLDCSALSTEIKNNDAEEARLQHQDKQVEQQNVAKNVAGVVPGVGILAVASTDLSNEEQVKARALADRNERLSYLAKQKGCNS